MSMTVVVAAEAGAATARVGEVGGRSSSIVLTEVAAVGTVLVVVVVAGEWHG